MHSSFILKCTFFYGPKLYVWVWNCQTYWQYFQQVVDVQAYISQLNYLKLRNLLFGFSIAVNLSSVRVDLIQPAAKKKKKNVNWIRIYLSIWRQTKTDQLV